MEVLTKKTGVVKWALIPVEFSDLKGENNFRARVDDQMKELSDWFNVVSEGKFKVEWVVSDKWITLPGVSSDYPLTKVTGVNNTPGGIKLFKSAMLAADPSIDFTGVQTVNFILPEGQNIANEGENGFPWDQHVKETITQEGPVSSFTIAGKYQTLPGNTLWSYWLHEFGHAVAWPHVGGNGPGPSPFHPWDIMGSQDGPSKELSGWIRFLTSWLSDEKVYCKESSKVTKVELTLAPLSGNENGLKLAMFPLSPSKALIVESRRVTKFSCTTATPRDGVLAYVLDLTFGHGQDFLVPLESSNKKPDENSICAGVKRDLSTNQLLYEGDSVTFGGLTVEVLKSSNFDRVVITRKP
jgi:M6 family metalloprotease-like protein